jgi:hypothetical protein
MQFRVGQIVAKCNCGSTQFKIPADEQVGPRMNYECAECGHVTQYAKLVEQIGREASRQRKARLATPASGSPRSEPGPSFLLRGKGARESEPD